MRALASILLSALMLVSAPVADLAAAIEADTAPAAAISKAPGVQHVAHHPRLERHHRTAPASNESSASIAPVSSSAARQSNLRALGASLPSRHFPIRAVSSPRAPALG
jgi:hypothetical protein